MAIYCPESFPPKIKDLRDRIADLETIVEIHKARIIDLEKEMSIMKLAINQLRDPIQYEMKTTTELEPDRSADHD